MHSNPAGSFSAIGCCKYLCNISLNSTLIAADLNSITWNMALRPLQTGKSLIPAWYEKPLSVRWCRSTVKKRYRSLSSSSPTAFVIPSIFLYTLKNVCHLENLKQAVILFHVRFQQLVHYNIRQYLPAFVWLIKNHTATLKGSRNSGRPFPWR